MIKKFFAFFSIVGVPALSSDANPKTDYLDKVISDYASLPDNFSANQYLSFMKEQKQIILNKTKNILKNGINLIKENIAEEKNIVPADQDKYSLPSRRPDARLLNLTEREIDQLNQEQLDPLIKMYRDYLDLNIQEQRVRPEFVFTQNKQDDITQRNVLNSDQKGNELAKNLPSLVFENSHSSHINQNEAYPQSNQNFNAIRNALLTLVPVAVAGGYYLHNNKDDLVKKVRDAWHYSKEKATHLVENVWNQWPRPQVPQILRDYFLKNQKNHDINAQ